MQRTLMTTILMFKNHPNLKNMRFVVLPIVREMLGINSDIAMPINQLMEIFGPGKEAAEGFNFDFSACY